MSDRPVQLGKLLRSIRFRNIADHGLMLMPLLSIMKWDVWKVEDYV